MWSFLLAALQLLILGPIVGLVAGAIVFMIYIWVLEKTVGINKLSRGTEDRMLIASILTFGSSLSIGSALLLVGTAAAVTAELAVLAVASLFIRCSEDDKICLYLQAAGRNGLKFLRNKAAMAVAPGMSQPVVATTLQQQRKQLDTLEEWASLTETQRAERARLIGMVTDNAERLSATTEEVQAESAKVKALTTDVQAVLKHDLPVEVAKGLAETVVTRGEEVARKQRDLTVLEGETEAASQALEAHVKQERPRLISAAEVLSASAAAMEEAKKSIGKLQ